MHERRQPDRRAHVVREDEEGASVRAHAAVQGHSVQDAPHGVLADTEVHGAPAGRRREQVVLPGQRRLVGARQVGRAAQQVGDAPAQPLQHLPGIHPGRERFWWRAQVGDVRVPAGRQFTGQRRLQLRGRGGMCRLVRLPAPPPLLLQPRPPHRRLPPVRQRFRLHVEGSAGRVAEVLLGRVHLVHAQRRSVSRRRPRLARAAVPDGGAHHHQRGPVRFRARARQRRVQRGQVGAAVHPAHVPPVCAEALSVVGGARQIGPAIDGDPVVVEHPDQLAQALVAGELGRLVRDPLHQVAVGAERPGVVVHNRVPGPVEAVRQPPLGERHPHRIGHPLAEGTGGGLHARRVPELRVARRHRSPLPEVPDLLQRQIVAGQVQQ